MPNVVIGSEGEATETVTPERTAGHCCSPMRAVFGTPFMIFLMEIAASRAIQSSLPSGWVSAGADVNTRHLAATPPGETVTARLAQG